MTLEQECLLGLPAHVEQECFFELLALVGDLGTLIEALDLVTLVGVMEHGCFLDLPTLVAVAEHECLLDLVIIVVCV